jgi:hypothetical protein
MINTPDQVTFDQMNFNLLKKHYRKKIPLCETSMKRLYRQDNVRAWRLSQRIDTRGRYHSGEAKSSSEWANSAIFLL